MKPFWSKSSVIIFIIFLLSFIINWYRLPEHLFFGHEQGRDAAAIRHIYADKDPTLIGPKTEINGLFTPPWYYYIMAIPYGLSGGDPLFASFFLVLISSTVAPIIYFFAKDLLKSTRVAILAVAIAITSFELVSYARWLINVTPAFPFITLALYMIWKYCKTQKTKFFLLFFLFSQAASQFQITLIFQFAFIFLALTMLKQTQVPSLKILLLCLLMSLISLSPLILFDLRHQFLGTHAIVDFISGNSDYQLNFSAPNSVKLYLQQQITVVQRSLFNFKNPTLQGLFFTLMLSGLFIFVKRRQNRQTLIFLMVISFMSLGIIPFNIGLTQLYQGTAIGWILLLTIALYSLWQKKQTRVLAAVLLSLLAIGWGQNLLYLHQNRGFFPVTISEGLNYKDQKELLYFVNNDSEVKPYRLEAFTIPYLHSEGWQYLQEYFFPHQESKQSKLVYVIIQKNVEPYWEERWLHELGTTQLILEKKFGEIRLQKRIISN